MWQVKKLEDAIRLEYGKPLPDSKRKNNGKFPVYGANGEKDRSDEYYCSKRSIIVGRKGSAGEVNLTENKFWPLDVTYYVDFDDNQYDLIFLYYLLKKLRLPQYVRGVKPGINRNDVYSIFVALPFLPEQKRIVAKIESLFSRLDSAKDSLGRVRQEIKRYRQSVLKAAFGGELTNIPLQNKELRSLVKINLRNDFKDNLDVGFLPMKLIEANFSGKHSFEVKKWGKVKSGFTHIKNDDVLLAKITPCFENGKSALVNGLPSGYGAATTEVFAITVNQTELLPKYLYLFLRQERFILEGKKLMTGAVGQKRVPRSYLESLLLPVCSLSEQREIIRNVESRFERTKVLEDAVEQGLEKIERLKQSILKKAFEGKLVESDPVGEPVEVLLERIRKEKAKLK
jgi:type I restriction enzyme S subunit